MGPPPYPNDKVSFGYMPIGDKLRVNGGFLVILDLEQTAEKERLVGLLEPVVRDHRAELVDLEFMGPNNNKTLRLLVHKDPGIGVDLCEAISREVADLLDVEDPIPGRYRLEVTSPGLDRPLVTDRDFSRVGSRQVKILLSSGHTYYGELVAWDRETITLNGEDGVEPIERKAVAKVTIEAKL